ncbi:hypothetical protein [Paenibacillus sp. MBLB4367]|uniref:hypothetical protein n=1 Tax=Paenibacillus sp. MBLB4367 TaxID=3384767 RepID=UPI0039082648
MRFVGIDPSTKAGLVILDKHGEILDRMEITSDAIGETRILDIADRVIEQLEPNDIVAVEGFSLQSKGAAVSLLYGIGWRIRFEMIDRGINYLEVPPTSLKKFTGAGGNASKTAVALAAFKRWEFEDKSDNITDAFVLAQIAKSIHQPTGLIKVQTEVIHSITNPPEKKKRKAKNE